MPPPALQLPWEAQEPPQPARPPMARAPAVLLLPLLQALLETLLLLPLPLEPAPPLLLPARLRCWSARLAQRLLLHA